MARRRPRRRALRRAISRISFLVHVRRSAERTSLVRSCTWSRGPDPAVSESRVQMDTRQPPPPTVHSHSATEIDWNSDAQFCYRRGHMHRAARRDNASNKAWMARMLRPHASTPAACPGLPSRVGILLTARLLHDPLRAIWQELSPWPKACWLTR